MKAKNNFYNILHSQIIPICSSHPTQATQNREVLDRNNWEFNSSSDILTGLMLRGIRPDFYTTNQLITYFYYTNQWSAVGSVVDRAVIMLSYCDSSPRSLTINSSICFFRKAKQPFPAFQRKRQKNPKPKTRFKCFNTYQLLWIRICQKFVSEVNWFLANLAVLHITPDLYYRTLWSIRCWKNMSEADSWVMSHRANSVKYCELELN